MDEWWGNLDDFGQQEDFTCAVACARTLLHLHGIGCSEQDFRTRLNVYPRPQCGPGSGYNLDQIARVLNDLGVRPHVRCDRARANSFKLASACVRHGTPDQLVDWLLRLVARKQAVNVHLDMGALTDPIPIQPVGHSILVLAVDAARQVVRYFDPGPPDHPPGRAAVRAAPLERVLAGWQAFHYLSLALETPTGSVSPAEHQADPDPPK